MVARMDQAAANQSQFTPRRSSSSGSPFRWPGFDPIVARMPRLTRAARTNSKKGVIDDQRESVEALRRRMQAVRKVGTRPELRTAALLRQLQMRFARNVSSLPGRPDFANQSQGLVVFVHGCFWHRHDCARATIPASNRDFWLRKFAKNLARDRASVRELQRMGFSTTTIWECEISSTRLVKQRLRALFRRAKAR
jgi:DNA mismatch endonuclease, patch repair protein